MEGHLEKGVSCCSVERLKEVEAEMLVCASPAETADMEIEGKLSAPAGGEAGEDRSIAKELRVEGLVFRVWGLGFGVSMTKKTKHELR